MRILFCTLPAFGHVYPLLPLADAARRAGHDVRFATAGEFADRLRLAGFPTTDVGLTLPEAYALLARTTGQPSVPRDDTGRPIPEVGGRLFVDVFGRSTATDLARELPSIAPDVVIYDQMAVGAAVAAASFGVTALCHPVSPILPAAILERILGDRLTLLYQDHGLDPAEAVWHGRDGLIDMFPDILQPVAPPPIEWVRVRPTAYSEPGSVVPRWLGRSGRPLVYMTLGTIVAHDDLLRPAIDGVAGLGTDVLVALGGADGTALGPLPDNVHVERFVDQATVLRHAQVAVHHGGSGTMLAAAAAGVSQVVLPKGADQFFNGDILRSSGVATVLEPIEATPAAIADAAAQALAGLSPAAERARAEIAALPSPDVALGSILEVVDAASATRAA